MFNASVSITADLFVRRRREDRHPRDLGEQCEVVETVVAGAVVARDARAVDAEDHREPVQADVVDELVPRTVQEHRIDRDHGTEPAHRHARGGGDRVLLGDPDVEATIGEALGEAQEPGGTGHAGGDRDDLRVTLGEVDERFGERDGVRRRAALAVLHAGLAIERADVVEALLVVGLGRRVALALAGEHVHDHRTVAPGGIAQRGLERVEIVAVDRAVVRDAERADERRHVAGSALDAVEARDGGRVRTAVVVQARRRRAGRCTRGCSTLRTRARR